MISILLHSLSVMGPAIWLVALEGAKVYVYGIEEGMQGKSKSKDERHV